MENYLESGGVLPSGLLSGNDSAEKIAGFNKTYRNYPLRLGVVTSIYPASDPNNFSKLSTEYDVSVFEQNEDRGNTIITYRNCIGADALGSIADFFDKNFRSLTKNNNPVGFMNTINQNGATVILLCLDAVSEKAVIIGGLNHPNRPTTLFTAAPYLEAEYNGANIKVNNDGSCSFTFRGATDNYGVPTDPSQGNTYLVIDPDGSFQVNHSTVLFRMDRTKGTATLYANQDIDIKANNNINVTASQQINVACTNLNVNASDSIDINCNGPTSISSTGNIDVTSKGDVTITAQGKSVINTTSTTTINSTGMLTIQSAVEVDVTAPIIKINGSVGEVLTNVTDPVVDFITLVPTIGLPNVLAGGA